MEIGTSTASPAQVWKPTISGKPRNGLGFPFFLILIYLFMEFARPASPMGIPMVISIVLFLNWVSLPQSEKKWPPQVICFFALFAVIAVMGPFAENNAAVLWGFRDMVVLLLFLCVPIMHFVNSMRKLTVFVNCLVGLYAYVAVYAALHGGFGPGAYWDENDVALALNSTIPFAFVSMLLARKGLGKAVFGGAFAIMICGVIATSSRGGFVGLVPMLVYCFVLSPKKMQTLAVGFILLLGVAILAPEEYWQEVSSIVGESSNENPLAGTGGLRRVFWAIAREMFYSHPIFGVGFGNFPYVTHLYQSEEIFQLVQRTIGGNVAHSLYFTVLAELGLAGIIVFVLILIYNFRDATFIQRQIKDRLNAVMAGPQNARSKLANPLMASKSRLAIFRTEAQGAVLRDLEQLSLYAHALRASFIGFLVNAIFLTVFTYPHFWFLTALAVILKLVSIDRLNEAKKVFSPEEGQMPVVS
jgi:O-antigen ligase